MVATQKKMFIQTFNRQNTVRIEHLHLLRLNGIVTYDLQFQNELLTIQIHVFTLIISLHRYHRSFARVRFVCMLSQIRFFSSHFQCRKHFQSK